MLLDRLIPVVAGVYIGKWFGEAALWVAFAVVCPLIAIDLWQSGWRNAAFLIAATVLSVLLVIAIKAVVG